MGGFQLVGGQADIEADQMFQVVYGQLRKKIETDPAVPQVITTVHGVGYRYVVDVVGFRADA